jgi:Zn-dependent protease with chaperone function
VRPEERSFDDGRDGSGDRDGRDGSDGRSVPVGPGPPVELTAMVGELARRAGVPAPELAVRPTANVAYVRGSRGRTVLVLDPSVPAAGTGIARAVVAHELGHVAAGHPTDARRRLLAIVVAAVCAGVAAYAGAAGALAAACATLTVSAVGTLGVLAQLRRHEFAADAAAVRLLGEATSTLDALEWLEHTHPRPPRRPGALVRYLDDHPPRAARVMALQATPPP